MGLPRCSTMPDWKSCGSCTAPKDVDHTMRAAKKKNARFVIIVIIIRFADAKVRKK
jgi:hypothetical protein